MAKQHDENTLRACAGSADSPRSLTASESVPSSIITPGTPLPWKVWPGDGIASEQAVERYHGSWVTRFDGDDSFAPDDEDARYIVTACNAYPKLIAALKGALPWMALYATTFDDVTHPQARENHAADMLLIQAALAKAEGR